MNRWCIIGSLRSGTTQLQHKIFLKSPKLSITLGEYTHNQLQIYEDSDGIFDKRYNSFYSNERIEFRNRMQKLIETTNVSMVMKVFPQPWVLTDFDYNGFFKTLSKNNFKFICINRNFFSRTISLAMAKTTGLWHRQYTIQGLKKLGNVNTNAGINNKIILTPGMIDDCVDIIIRHDTFLKTLRPAETIDINYETINADCEKNRIPIVNTGPHIKTYNDSYADIIENYKEIKNMKEWTNYG